MASSHASHDLESELKKAAPFVVASGTRMLFGIFLVVGVLAILLGLKSGQGSRVWGNILMNYFLYLCLGLGGLFFVALQHITSAAWSVPVRRVAEGLTSFLPVAGLVAVLILLVGGPSLYEWLHHDAMEHDALLASKAGYLNLKFALVRLLVSFAIWIGVARKLVNNSLAQDQTGSKAFTLNSVKWSAFFLVAFAVSFSFHCFDFIMALEPHWFSTIFGVYCFAGLFYSTLSTLVILAVSFQEKGVLPVFNENHLHDLGKFMFGFVIFMAYIGFSQFMLIWYANLPEETVYYIKRFEGNWAYLYLLLLATKFVVPFFALMPRAAVRSPQYLRRVAVFMLAAHWLDLYLLVMPNALTQGPAFGVSEVGISLGFLGLFGLVVTRFYGRFPVLAYRDPRMEEAHQFHQ